MGERKWGPEASRVVENPREDCHGVGGGVELLRGTDTSVVEELPQGDETSGLNLKGNGVPGTDGRGRGGEGNSSATWVAEVTTLTSRR